MPTTRQYRCADVLRFPMGDGRELIYSKASCSSRVLQTSAVELLARCQSFQTLENHAQALGKEFKLTSTQSTAIKTLLSQLARKGFLISYEETLNRIQKTADSSDKPPPIATIGIPTCDRPELLQRALTSYIENCKEYGRKNDFVVMDDSRSSNNRRYILGMIRTLSARYKAKILYAGPEERRVFVKRLVKKGIPQDIAHFALFGMPEIGCATGANRNALLLHTVGDMFLSVDDDTVCRLASPPQEGESMAVSSKFDPTEFRFFPNLKTALHSANFIKGDALAIHEQLLGKEVGNLFCELPNTVTSDLNQATSSFLHKLQYGTGKVATTMCGLIGDCAMSLPHGYLALHDDSRRQLLSSHLHYKHALSRQVLRAVNRPTITEGALCLAYAIGLDNRALLPPFLPVLRNQDGLFGVLLQRCLNRSYFGYLPWAVLHAPQDARPFALKELREIPWGIRVSDLFIKLAVSFEMGSGRPDEKLRTFGRYLLDIGSQTSQDFMEFTRTQIWNTQSQYIDHLENLLKVHDEKPEFWARDVKKRLLLLRKAVLKYNVPLDLMEKREASEALKCYQRLMLDFGRLLQWWPEIVETAKTLRIQEGIKL